MSDQMYEATLIRGRIYVYAGHKFEKGKKVLVTADEKAWLTEHARDPIDIKEGDGKVTQEWRQKFDFVPEGVTAQPAPDHSIRTRERPAIA